MIFYKNNKEVNKVKGSLKDTGYSEEGKYIISVDGGYMLYNSDGKPIIDKVFKKINSYYGKYFYAQIDDNNYVFFDGKKISDSYYSVGNNVENYYYVEPEKDVYNIVDSSTGKKMLPDSKVVYSALKKGNILLAYTKTDDETTIYNLKTGKEIVKLSGKVHFYEYYFTNTTKDIIDYYSYSTGKKFLERKNN